MNMYIEILDRNTDTLLNVSTTHIRSFSEQDLKDRQGNIHYLLVYALEGSRYIEEEFASTSDRTEKVNDLNEYFA